MARFAQTCHVFDCDHMRPGVGNSLRKFAVVVQGVYLLALTEKVAREAYAYLGDLLYCSHRGDTDTHLLNVISDILDISKIEAGEATSLPGEVDLAETINACITMIVPRAVAKRIELLLELPSPLWTSRRHVDRL